MYHNSAMGRDKFFDILREDITTDKEANKGVRRMPRLPEAKKDVISCDKPRRGANNR